MSEVANLIADALEKPEDEADLEGVKGRVKALAARFPVYANLG